MRLIIFGPPGVGKGTITQMLQDVKPMLHISTGDLLREAVAEGTELGQKVKAYMESGDLVPDETIMDVVKERVTHDDAKEGFVLDGFPRDLKQAKMMDDEGIDIDHVIDLKADNETVINRISSRRICSSCERVYNLLTMRPQKEGHCDVCGGEIYQRSDDAPEKVRHRLEVYWERTEPLIEFFREKGNLIDIDASVNDPKVVFQRVRDALGL